MPKFRENSEILQSIYQEIQEHYQLGLIDEHTMQQFSELCLTSENSAVDLYAHLEQQHQPDTTH